MKLISGDVFRIPLNSSNKAFGQLLLTSKKYGSLIRIFDLTVPLHDRIEVDFIVKRPMLFPPIYTLLKFAVLEEGWEIIGSQPIGEVEHPRFVSTLYNSKTGNAGVWFEYDGNEERRIGKKLDLAQTELEYLFIWPPKDIVNRISYKIYPFPYRELMINNSFNPQNH